MVYNANHLAQLIRDKEKYQNKAEYLQKRQATRPESNPPMLRVKLSSCTACVHLFNEILLYRHCITPKRALQC